MIGTARVMVNDEASAKCFTGSPSVSRDAMGLIRVTVRHARDALTMSQAYSGHLEMSAALWRQVIQDVQSLLTVPTDRGPGEFDQTVPESHLFAKPAVGGVVPCCDRGLNCDCGVPLDPTQCGWENDERLPPCGKADCERCVRHGTVAPESHLFARPGGEPWDDDTGAPVG